MENATAGLSVGPTFDGRTTRPPWPDELHRVRHLLPEPFLVDENPLIFVGATGRVERLAALGAIVTQDTPTGRAGWFCLRTSPGEDQADWTAALARDAVGHARRRHLSSLVMAQTFERDSDPVRILGAFGFEPEHVMDLYAMETRPYWERLQRLHERVRRLDIIPPGVRVTTLLPRMVGKVREFLRREMPGSNLTLLQYKLDHSLVLFVRKEIKGIILNHRAGNATFAALRVVASELRGGFGWANLLLNYTCLESAMEAGCTENYFELDPKAHADTEQMAQIAQARKVRRNVLLKWKA